MKALKDLSDKVSDFADKRGLANPVEVVNEALGGETREESKKRREAAKQPVEPTPLSLEERKKAAAKKAKDEYDSDRKNWPLNPKEAAIRAAEAADAVEKKKGGSVSSYKAGGSVRSSASKRADGCAIRGKTRA
jgi:hypothetical protein